MVTLRLEGHPPPPKHTPTISARTRTGSCSNVGRTEKSFPMTIWPSRAMLESCSCSEPMESAGDGRQGEPSQTRLPGVSRWGAGKKYIQYFKGQYARGTQLPHPKGAGATGEVWKHTETREQWLPGSNTSQQDIDLKLLVEGNDEGGKHRLRLIGSENAAPL